MTPTPVHAQAEAPGFFGKLMAHADFVARRVPPKLRQFLDLWLQECVQRSRYDLGAGWVETYLQSPLWRFALAPHVFDEHAWAGLLMPSVDQVGRQFPLILIMRLPAEQSVLACLRGADAWYAWLEKLALSSLDADFVLDDFAAALLNGPPIFALSRPLSLPLHAERHRLSIQGLDALPRVVPALAQQFAELGLQGRSLWWSDGSEKITPSLLMCRGLPDPAGFSGMLGGDWQRSGWHSQGG